MSTDSSVARESAELRRRTTYLGRQPVFDRDLEVVAYELLYRSSCENEAGVLDGNRATAEVFANTFMELGLDTVAGSLPVLINLPRSFLLEDYGELLPPDRIMLEVLEDVEPDADVVSRVQALSDAGYRIVLDDFLFRRCLAILDDIDATDRRLCVERVVGAEWHVERRDEHLAGGATIDMEFVVVLAIGNDGNVHRRERTRDGGRSQNDLPE